MRTSARQRARNRAYRTKLKFAVRKVREAENPDAAREALKDANKLIDRIAGKGIIHRNRAADKKRRLHQFVRSMDTQQAA